jgi:hypothetical protein
MENALKKSALNLILKVTVLLAITEQECGTSLKRTHALNSAQKDTLSLMTKFALNSAWMGIWKMEQDVLLAMNQTA